MTLSSKKTAIEQSTPGCVTRDGEACHAASGGAAAATTAALQEETIQSLNAHDIAALSANVQEGLMRLFVKQCRLYTCGGSSSITSLEAHDLLDSIRFVLRAHDLDDPATLRRLASDDMDTLFHQGLEDINRRVDETMDLWSQVCLTMPPIKNIALRDTLASIGQFRKVYDTYFAAFAVPVSIDYPLHNPVPETLQGVDYVHEWLVRCLAEARYIAQFDTKECIAVLKRACPDYKGLLINLYEPIHRHFGEKGRQR